MAQGRATFGPSPIPHDSRVARDKPRPLHDHEKGQSGANTRHRPWPHCDTNAPQRARSGLQNGQSHVLALHKQQAGLCSTSVDRANIIGPCYTRSCWPQSYAFSWQYKGRDRTLGTHSRSTALPQEIGQSNLTAHLRQTHALHCDRTRPYPSVGSAPAPSVCLPELAASVDPNSCDLVAGTADTTLSTETLRLPTTPHTTTAMNEFSTQA